MANSWSNGWNLAKQSGRLLMAEKSLVVFPLLSGAACVAVMLSFLTPLLLLSGVMDNPDALARKFEDSTVLNMALLFAFYFVLVLVYPSGMGFGDVKLAGVLGLYLGWVSWGAVVLGTFTAFLIGAVVGIVVMLAGKGGRKTKIPFGPFMFVGAGLALVLAQPVVDWYVGTLGL